MKTAVFRTFKSGLKDPQNGLALIWRYFFEGFKFLKNRDFEKPDFPNFEEFDFDFVLNENQLLYSFSSLPVPDVTVNTRRGVYVTYEPAQNEQEKRVFL